MKISPRPAKPPSRISAVWMFRFVLFGVLLIAFVAGGPITRAIAIAAALLAVFAGIDGATRHLFHVGGFLAACYFAPSLGAMLGDWLGSQVQIPLLAARLVGVVLTGVAMVMIASLVGRALSVSVQRGRFASVDHMLGSMAGAVEGALVIATVCWMVVEFDQPLRQMRDHPGMGDNTTAKWVIDRLGDIRSAIQEDPAGQALVRVNPLSNVSSIQTARDVISVVTDSDAFKALLEDEDMLAIARLPEIRAHIDAFEADTALRDAVDKHDLGVILRSQQFYEMLTDRKLHEALASHVGELRSALANVSKEQAERAMKNVDVNQAKRALGSVDTNRVKQVLSEEEWAEINRATTPRQGRTIDQ